MTYYIAIASAGYAFMAVVAVLDKFILTKSLKVPAYAFYSTIFFFGAFALLPFSEAITFGAFFWALASALAFGFATWAMFLGLKHGEATHIVPFIGAVTAAGAYVFSALLLGESLSLTQTAGIVLLIAASLLFAYEKTEGRRKRMHQGFAWALLSGVLFAFSHATAKYFYLDHSFITGLTWTKGLVGIVALFTLLSVSTRKDVFGKKETNKSTDKKNVLGIVAADKILAVAGTVAIQYAIALGSVTIVSGLVGLQYALTLAMVLMLTAFAPRLFSEYFTKKEIVLEIAAIVLVAVGVLLLI